MDAGKVAEGGFLRWIFCWITSQLPQILQETYWSPHGSEIHPENTQVWWWKNHGLGLHPAWGVQEIGRVEGNINSLKYQEVSAAAYIPNHKRGQILQQDGAPMHTSISTSKFIKVLQNWPAQSPDMNIIEHVWGRMKEEAWKTKPKNIDELWEACKTAFFAIPDDFINKLYESLPNRMDAVLQAHGSRARYSIWISQHHYLIRWCYVTYFCIWSKLLVQFSHYFL